MGNFSFLRKPPMPVGLEIGTNTFRAVQIKPTSTLPIITAYGSIRVPHGAVEEGEIVDIETVANVLSRLWRQAGFVGKKVILGVANQKVVARLIELPYMEKSELQGAIQYQAQDYIPIPIEEAILDFQIVGEFVNESEERMLEVLLVAAQKDMISSNVAALEGAYLRPEFIDVSSFAIARCLTEPPSVVSEEGEEAVALVNIASGTTNIVITEKGVPRFTRVTGIGGNDFTIAISEMLGIPFDEADELKIEAGLSIFEEKEKEKEEKTKRLSENIPVAQAALEAQADKFVAEVRRSFDYYLTQRAGVTGIQRVILSGGGAKLKNLPQYMENGLQVSVEFGKPLKKFQIGPKVSKEVLEEDELSMTICLGLALRGLEK